jgi:RNA polymerase sigma factor (TIGR02999 family)
MHTSVGELDQAETTRLLRSWAEGDRAALDLLAPRVYKELRRVAGNLMRAELGGRTLTATALVHETYLKLVDVGQVDVDHRAHFLALAAKVMRQILLDKARRRRAAKRGDGAIRVDLDAVAEVVASETKDRALIALDDALEELVRVDERRARVVEMRYFGGLSVEETASALHVSVDTVMRDWKVARAWLTSRMRS